MSKHYSAFRALQPAAFDEANLAFNILYDARLKAWPFSHFIPLLSLLNARVMRVANGTTGRYAHVCPWKRLRCSPSLLLATEDALGGTGRPNVVRSAHSLLASDVRFLDLRVSGMDWLAALSLA